MACSDLIRPKACAAKKATLGFAEATNGIICASAEASYRSPNTFNDWAIISSSESVNSGEIAFAAFNCPNPQMP